MSLAHELVRRSDGHWLALGVYGLCRNLSSYQLTGPVPPAIGQVTSLTSLDLSNNAISGPFPPELALLQSLQFL
jgi:hypothetical protein